MKVDKEGSLVWVQRNDGKWWPGGVVSLAEISASDHSSFASKIPIMLLGRNSGSVEWHKLENSRCIKSFRCGDSDNFIKEAESSQVSVCAERVKCAHQEDGILDALQLEKQEDGTKLKRPVNVHKGASQAKRSRCVYFPVESFNHVEHSVLHSRPMKFSHFTLSRDDYSRKPIVAESIYSEATISGFSGRDIKDSEGLMHSIGNCRRQTRSMNVKEEESISTSSKSFHGAGIKKQNSGENSNTQNGSWTPMIIMNAENSMRSRKRMRNMRDLLMANAARQDESKCWYEHKSGEQSPLEVNELSDSSCEGSQLEDSESVSFCSLSAEHPNWLNTMLMDVEVTVLANHRREDVPLVSLMSRLNGKAIIGHPIETEALDDASDVFLAKKGEFHRRLENEENRMNQLVWRTCKRTPVCYIASVNACPSKGEEKIFGVSSVKARRGSPPTEKALWKPQIPVAFSKNEARELYNANRKKDGLQEQKGCAKERATCVPVNCIFSNLLLAVGRE